MKHAHVHVHTHTHVHTATYTRTHIHIHTPFPVRTKCIGNNLLYSDQAFSADEARHSSLETSCEKIFFLWLCAGNIKFDSTVHLCSALNFFTSTFRPWTSGPLQDFFRLPNSQCVWICMNMHECMSVYERMRVWVYVYVLVIRWQIWQRCQQTVY